MLADWELSATPSPGQVVESNMAGWCLVSVGDKGDDMFGGLCIGSGEEADGGSWFEDMMVDSYIKGSATSGPGLVRKWVVEIVVERSNLVVVIICFVACSAIRQLPKDMQTLNASTHGRAKNR